MIPLTPERIAAVYECLRAFPIFDKWKLPQSHALGFHVSKTNLIHGSVYEQNAMIWMEVSTKGVSTLALLQTVVGHEMVHVKQKVDKLETPNTFHNADFMKRWRSVCSRYGWDQSLFV